jgi:hypothetical protein
MQAAGQAISVFIIHYSVCQVQLIIHNNFRLKIKIRKCAKSIDGLLLLMSAQALLVLCVETLVLPAAACRLGLKKAYKVPSFCF